MNLSMAEFLKYPGKDGKPAVKGVSLFTCIAGEEWDDHCSAAELGAGKREHAHGHWRDDDPAQGWICVRFPEEIGRRHRVSGTLMHELAHLVAKAGHNDKWRRRMRLLGQFVAPAWQKKTRVAKA